MSAEKIIDEVVKTCCSSGSARQKEIIESFIRHLLGFVADIKPSDEEWMEAIQFLTSVGHMCDHKRQEFILLSDVMGVTALKDYLNNVKPDEATEATVLGPFYREGVKTFPLGTNISGGKEDGERCLVKGRVTDIEGSPIPGAIVDVWQSASNGLYEQQDDNQPDMNLRGCFKTDNEGYYWLETVKPKYYPIPTDGPVGKLLKQLGRHEYRPGHIHFIVSADSYDAVTTQYFDKESLYIESDAVFGVKESLAVEFGKAPENFEYKGIRLGTSEFIATCDFVLTQAS